MSESDWPAARHVATAALIARIQGIVLFILTLAVVAMALEAGIGENGFEATLAAMVLGGVALLHYGAGWHLARFSREARAVLTVVALPNVLLFPVGTAWFGYLVWAAWGGRGRRWFSTEQAREPAPPFRALATLAVAASVMVISAWMLTAGVAIPTVAQLSEEAENAAP
jgi:hypothetical protein